MFLKNYQLFINDLLAVFELIHDDGHEYHMLLTYLCAGWQTVSKPSVAND